MKAFTRNASDLKRSNRVALSVAHRPGILLLRTIGMAIVWLVTSAASQADPPVDPKQSNASTLQPELRYVAVEQASLHAGPSEEFYPTLYLQRGDAIEVYHRTGDGWLAVRPPQGSFSWLPAAQGLLLPGGRVVEVTDKAAVAWIGTSLGTAKQYRWQVKLNHGEQLAVIGEQTIRDEASGKQNLWYKITPPSGEYRWIKEQATTSDKPGNALDESANEVAADDPESDDSDANLVAEAANDGDVQQAGFEEVVGTSVRRQASRANRAGTSSKSNANAATSSSGNPNANEDPWDSWHAVEFKNGMFSFPGVARMFGIQPAGAANHPRAYDPFDPRNQTRSRNTPVVDELAHSSSTNVSSPSGSSNGSRTDATTDGLAAASNDEATHSLLEGESRGWRDPRQLRIARQRSTNSNNAVDASSMSMLAAQPQDASSGVSALESANEAIGSAVVPASMNMPGDSSSRQDQSSRQGDDEAWYGIRQAPPVSSAKTVQPGGPAVAGDRPKVLTHADLTEVQVRLSEMVAGPESTWNLAPLADRTRYLIEHGATAIERGEARLLLDRIDAFSQLAKRSHELGMTQAPPKTQLPVASAINSSSPLNAAAARWTSPLGVTPASEAGSASSVAPRFDATGWIVPVHGSNRDMPTHALTNDSGKIIVYLTPAPGINLARFQAQAVGVYGLRGYLPQLRANHIQVQRVVRLQ